MILLARRLRDTNGALAATSFLSLKGRVARALLSLAEAFGQDVGGGRILVRQNSPRPISARWPGSRAKMSAGS